MDLTNMYRVQVAGKQIILRPMAIDDLLSNLVNTVQINYDIKVEFANKIIAQLTPDEQDDLLEEMENEMIYPLGWVVKPS
jgi:hypothetical protein